MARDVEATRSIYAQIVEGGADECVCDYCKNYARLRSRVFPEEAQIIFEQLGVDWHCEAEAVHYYVEDSGLHFYRGWFHFVGNIEPRGTQIQITENFLVDFCAQYAPMFSQLKHKPTVRLDFFTRLP